MVRKSNKLQSLSIIDRDLTIEGTLKNNGKLIIKGVVKGSIEGNSVVIAEEGSAFANINTQNLIIGGVLEGDVNASGKLIILASGKCSGHVVCKDLVVENGGVLNADVACKMSGQSAVAEEEVPDTSEVEIQDDNDDDKDDNDDIVKQINIG